LNPSFESPVQPSVGNNLLGTTTYGSWVLTGSTINVIRTDGSPYSGGPDNAQDGSQYVDIVSSAGTVYQDFSISTATPVGFGGYFSSREVGTYVDWTASVEIYSMPSNTLVASSNTRAFTAADGADPAQENWYYIFGNTTLPAGNYRYVANLGDYGNFDNGFVFTNCTLPIALDFFSIRGVENANILNWKIESASQFSHFEIERSNDGRSFSTIANVPLGTGNEYSFTDNRINGSSILYYRLKMVDIDGRYKYSAILKSGENNKLMITPNPARDYLYINGLTQKGELKIIDIAGKILRKQFINAQSISVHIDFLQTGLYLLQYSDGRQIKTMKFMKM
ncbi:MAG: T9SS type A sorting domain-containing protein, partial [Bacteroidetes bacterium]|nr:T9SS type A sorting domain-containing protein [Bacteroidota bacterium]